MTRPQDRRFESPTGMAGFFLGIFLDCGSFWKFDVSTSDYSSEIFEFLVVFMIGRKERKSEQALGSLLPGANRDSFHLGTLGSA